MSLELVNSIEASLAKILGPGDKAVVVAEKSLLLEQEERVKKDIASHWDRRSRWFDGEQGLRTERQENAWRDLLHSELGEPSVRALDVGTGTGVLAILLAELGHRSTGCELSPRMLEVAKRNAQVRGAEVTWELGDAENLSQADGTFDLVVNRNVLWTLPDPLRALSEWHRVLVPGGRLLVIDGDWFDRPLSYRIQQLLATVLVLVTKRRNPWPAIRRRRSKYQNQFEGRLTLMRPGSRQKILDLIARAGFEEIQTRLLPEIDKAEKSDLTLAQKWMRPHRFYSISASKALS